jgi:hypothetical protein
MLDDIFAGLAHHAVTAQLADHFAGINDHQGRYDHWAHHEGAVGTDDHFATADWHSALAVAHQQAHSPIHDPLATQGVLQGEPVPYHATWDPATFHGVGNPVGDSKYWQQQHENDCAVMAQTDVYNAITGHHLTEQEALNIVTQHGWYDNGTTLEDTGKLLSFLGIPVHQSTDASFQDLYSAVQKGEQVIVGLNANEIWFPYHDSATGAPVEQAPAGHAVWVTGIDQAPDGSVKVILSDTGKPGGQIEAVDAADFMNAWHDFGNFMVTTPPEHIM